MKLTITKLRQIIKEETASYKKLTIDSVVYDVIDYIETYICNGVDDEDFNLLLKALTPFVEKANARKEQAAKEDAERDALKPKTAKDLWKARYKKAHSR